MRQSEQNDQYDYFYADEAMKFEYLYIPLELFTNPAYQDTSTEAKFLYSMLLEKLPEATKNKWIDDEGRVFIYFPIQDVMEMLRCSKPAGIKYMQQLDEDTGCGLIKRIRQGMGMPDRIYVKRFA